MRLEEYPPEYRRAFAACAREKLEYFHYVGGPAVKCKACDNWRPLLGVRLKDGYLKTHCLRCLATRAGERRLEIRLRNPTRYKALLEADRRRNARYRATEKGRWKQKQWELAHWKERAEYEASKPRKIWTMGRRALKRAGFTRNYTDIILPRLVRNVRFKTLAEACIEAGLRGDQKGRVNNPELRVLLPRWAYEKSFLVAPRFTWKAVDLVIAERGVLNPDIATVKAILEEVECPRLT